jgi:hypothetical protein
MQRALTECSERLQGEAFATWSINSEPPHSVAVQSTERKDDVTCLMSKEHRRLKPKMLKGTHVARRFHHLATCVLRLAPPPRYVAPKSVSWLGEWRCWAHTRRLRGAWNHEHWAQPAGEGSCLPLPSSYLPDWLLWSNAPGSESSPLILVFLSIARLVLAGTLFTASLAKL